MSRRARRWRRKGQHEPARASSGQLRQSGRRAASAPRYAYRYSLFAPCLTRLPTILKTNRKLFNLIWWAASVPQFHSLRYQSYQTISAYWVLSNCRFNVLMNIYLNKNASLTNTVEIKHFRNVTSHPATSRAYLHAEALSPYTTPNMPSPIHLHHNSYCNLFFFT